MLFAIGITRVGLEGTAEASFFEGAYYSDEVSYQMLRGAGEFHSFPRFGQGIRKP